MDKNAIKKYAVWAREELIERVSQKAYQYEISADADPNADSAHGVLLNPLEKKQRVSLINKVKDKGMDQVIEEVAYTWFNRFAALRFMEVNNYLPSRVRVFTDEEGAFKPEILTEAIHLELKGLDMEKVYALKEANDDEALFKYLIIAQCNALSSVLPGMFQKIADYTELLFPDNLLREGSVVEQMVTQIPEDNWKDQVQIIGWLYQYYNTEPKDKVFADLKKNKKITKDKIPAATQLFTPDWIVRYMVENSLGRLWIEGHPNDDLKANWKYYLKEAEQEPEVQKQLDEIHKEYSALTPEDILCVDPCMGSGHIICYLFDVLMQIYEAYGYTTRDAVSSIVRNNLYGLDIDDRASRLAYFSVMMKACQYDHRFLSRGIQPHVYAIMESNHLDPNIIDFFTDERKELKSAMNSLISDLYDAKEYGSILDVRPVDFTALYARFDEIREQNPSVYTYSTLNQLFPFVQMAEVIAQKYHITCTNPPYMKEDNIPHKLHEYILKKWPDAKYDLYSAFIHRCFESLLRDGYMAMITMHNFMFSPSFLEFREYFWQKDWSSMVHLGSRAFSEISGEVVQTTLFCIAKTVLRRKVVVIDVTDFKDAEEKENQFLLRKHRPYVFDMKDTDEIPWKAMGYALSDKVLNYYKKGLLLEKHCVAKAGIVTGDDEYFCKWWFEVNLTDITFSPKPRQLYKYVPFSRGGTFVSWYGNTHHVLRIEDMWDDHLTNKSVRRGDINYYYKNGIGWSQMGGGVNKKYSIIENSICKTTTPMLYPDDDAFRFILGYLNSPIPARILKSLNPTLSILISDILHLPYIANCNEMEDINKYVDKCIKIARQDNAEKETTWDFRKNSLIKKNNTIEESFAIWRSECNDRFDKLKANEEELNRIFIDIYGLQDELMPEEEEKDVTVRKADLERDIRSFVSYAVGCMFGRYSLDVDGLAYAGGDWDDSKYRTFIPDKDAIIPITDDEYFTDDIVGRFVDFIRTVYGEDTLEENLKFIADALGEKGETSREVIRNYFLNDFYKDHCKIYQKRPIYWLFDSGKKNGFKCLIYMHRYQPDTIARIRTDYVHEQQARYRTAISGLERQISGASTSDRVRLNKQLEKLKDQAEETRLYEEKIHHLADQMISIDLDDGVKHNYAIFQDVLAKIK